MKEKIAALLIEEGDVGLYQADIAELANTSLATVCRVLKELVLDGHVRKGMNVSKNGCRYSISPTGRVFYRNPEPVFKPEPEIKPKPEPLPVWVNEPEQNTQESALEQTDFEPKKTQESSNDAQKSALEQSEFQIEFAELQDCVFRFSQEIITFFGKKTIINKQSKIALLDRIAQDSNVQRQQTLLEIIEDLQS